MPTDPPDSLPFSTIDPHSPIPLYYQIYLDLKQMLQGGVISSSGKLPPEMEMCRAYHVGRQTVRQALAMLVDEKLVERFPGRGTFIRNQPRVTQFFLDRSFSRQMHELGCSPHSRVIRIEKGRLDAGNNPALQTWNGAVCVTIERLRLGDGEPVCHQTSCILSARFPGIERHDFSTASLYEIIATEYPLIITRIDHVVRAVAADRYHANLLGIPEGAALLLVGTMVYSDDGDLIEYSNSYYRADRYVYSTTQTCCG